MGLPVGAPGEVGAEFAWLGLAPIAPGAEFAWIGLSSDCTWCTRWQTHVQMLTAWSVLSHSWLVRSAGNPGSREKNQKKVAFSHGAYQSALALHMADYSSCRSSLGVTSITGLQLVTVHCYVHPADTSCTCRDAAQFCAACV